MNKKECIGLLNSGNVENIVNAYGQEINKSIPPQFLSNLFGEAVGYFVHKYHIDRIINKHGQLVRFFDNSEN